MDFFQFLYRSQTAHKMRKLLSNVKSKPLLIGPKNQRLNFCLDQMTIRFFSTEQKNDVIQTWVDFWQKKNLKPESKISWERKRKFVASFAWDCNFSICRCIRIQIFCVTVCLFVCLLVSPKVAQKQLIKVNVPYPIPYMTY